MKRIPVFLLLLPLAGCAASPEPAYDPAAFSCILSVDSVSTGERGRFTAEYTRADNVTVLTLTAPERLAGLVFTFTDYDCTLSAEDCEIPLSAGAAASLRGLTDLLACLPKDASDSRSEGGCTTLSFDIGQITLDEAGLPVLVETADGRRAEVILPGADADG